MLSQAVQEAERRIREGEQRPEAIVEAMRKKVAEAPLARLEYAEVVDAYDLQPIEEVAPGQEVLAALAVYFGETRLIDNAFVEAPSA